MMRLLIFIFQIFIGAGAWAYPYGDDIIRSQCVASLARSSYFVNHPLKVSDHMSVWNHEYQLSPNAVTVSKEILWSIDEFIKNGNVNGRLHLQTVHAQLLLIAKAYAELEIAKISHDEVADLLTTLKICENLQVNIPVNPDSQGLYTNQVRSASKTAADLSRAIKISL